VRYLYICKKEYAYFWQITNHEGIKRGLSVRMHVWRSIPRERACGCGCTYSVNFTTAECSRGSIVGVHIVVSPHACAFISNAYYVTCNTIREATRAICADVRFISRLHTVVTRAAFPSCDDRVCRRNQQLALWIS